uniref:Uncharacterized protein n=1 Tax=Magallana gigas TaxID=29159 RepID=A0A8W8MW10_MAGGI
MAGIYLAVLVLISIPVKSNGDSDLISRISKFQFQQSLLNKTGKPVIRIPPFGRLPVLMQQCFPCRRPTGCRMRSGMR